VGAVAIACQVLVAETAISSTWAGLDVTGAAGTARAVGVATAAVDAAVAEVVTPLVVPVARVTGVGLVLAEETL